MGPGPGPGPGTGTINVGDLALKDGGKRIPMLPTNHVTFNAPNSFVITTYHYQYVDSQGPPVRRRRKRQEDTSTQPEVTQSADVVAPPTVRIWIPTSTFQNIIITRRTMGIRDIVRKGYHII